MGGRYKGITAEIDVREMERMLDAGVKEYELAASTSLNYATKRARTQVIRRTAKRVNLPQWAIRDRLYFNRAHRKKLRASLKLYTRDVSAGKERLKPKQNKIGVAVKGRTFPGAFLARKNGIGAQQAFRRTSKKRHPLKAIKINIKDDAEKVMMSTMRLAPMYLKKKLEPELMRRLKNAAR